MSVDLEIRHCRVLVAVSTHGSVSAAARELKLAQSTISETLLSLERVVGVQIMQRRPGREAALSAAAERLLPHARALISASEAAVAALAGNSHCVIRVGAVESVSSYILPQALAAFRASWPAVEVQINIGLCDNLLERIRLSKLDLALTLEGSTRARAEYEGFTRRLSPARLCFVVSKPPGAGQVQRADFIGRTFLLPDPDGAFPELLRAWFSQWNHRPRFESAGSIEGVKSGVQSSDVVGVLPRYAVSEDFESGSLFELKAPEALPPVSLGLTIQRAPIDASPFQHLVRQIEGVLDRAA